MREELTARLDKATLGKLKTLVQRRLQEVRGRLTSKAEKISPGFLIVGSDFPANLSEMAEKQALEMIQQCLEKSQGDPGQFAQGLESFRNEIISATSPGLEEETIGEFDSLVENLLKEAES